MNYDKHYAESVDLPPEVVRLYEKVFLLRNLFQDT